jgi:FkbM family methyltransferase
LVVKNRSVFEKYIKPESLVGGVFFHPTRHIYLLLTNKAYRVLSLLNSKYKTYPRYKHKQINVDGMSLSVPDMTSFIGGYKEIFVDKIYDVPDKGMRILDLGANIGISCLRFKLIDPKSTIVAYEADSKIFKHLSVNTKKHKGIVLHNKAVFNKDCTLSFNHEGSDGGRVDNNPKVGMSVKAKGIKKILEEEGPFDYIKMDIEGSESVVISECRGLLEQTKYFFCEYHSFEHEEQKLNDILSILRKEGFRINIQTLSICKQPFLAPTSRSGFDMQLNIFAWKL